MSGYIVERNALPNMYVQPDTRLFAITDLSRVWIYAAVFQDELGKVRPGNLAVVTVDAYPGTSFEGRVDFIQPQIDPMTRTAKVRCEFNNPKGQLFPGMFTHVALDIPMGQQTVIPDTAVLRTGTHNVAFIDRGDGYLTPTEVELGPHLGDEFIVLKGLMPGHRRASFRPLRERSCRLLRAWERMLLKERLRPHREQASNSQANRIPWCAATTRRS
jgi:RND family efflux transporter MFP subunit